MIWGICRVIGGMSSGVGGKFFKIRVHIICVYVACCRVCTK